MSSRILKFRNLNLLNRLFSRFRTMDSDSEDVLSQSQSIINRYIQEKGQTEGVREYLDNVKYPPVQDFAEGKTRMCLCSQ